MLGGRPPDLCSGLSLDRVSLSDILCGQKAPSSRMELGAYCFLGVGRS